MLRDIVGSNHKSSSNLMVISKSHPQDTESRRVLRALNSRGSHVLLVQPQPESQASEQLFHRPDLLCCSTYLLDGRKAMDHKRGTPSPQYSLRISHQESRKTQEWPRWILAGIVSLSQIRYPSLKRLALDNPESSALWPGCLLDVGQTLGICSWPTSSGQNSEAEEEETCGGITLSRRAELIY
ncbi:predicted protein [Arabidopsis lyrata subsp. lyrata]|uniref:Predicted protein n=1 Tax=Arabidopsis lyrata subsp. lyrata TaxID=81972 RepID=D7LKD7_ARALL|nr:predicted protein [Arabidopsis lyrata subsp. lyrata]